MRRSKKSKTGKSYMNQSLASILTLRSEWEHIVHHQFKRKYELPFYDGTLENLAWFIEHGAKKNRFRKNFKKAMEIAHIIVNYNEKFNLSSVGRKTIETLRTLH